VLASLLERQQHAPAALHCQGTLLSQAHYLVDIARWGYRDARLQPEGAMTADEIARWTIAMTNPYR